MQLPFYFDYACPWAYLGSSRVEAYFRDLGCEIDFRPVHLGTLKEPSSGKRPEPGPRKKTDYRNDLRHWAEMIGVEISPDSRSLLRSDTRLALRAALVAKQEGRFREYHHPAYRARWAEARDLSKPETVAELLAGAGLDADAALARADSEEMMARLESDTRAAIERGVFGVPTVFVGDEMFWGNDRFELAKWYIQKANGSPGA